MARTAPVPNIPPIPGMCPSIAVMGGGGGSGPGGGAGGGAGDGSGSGDGSGNGDGAAGDGSTAPAAECTGEGHPVDVASGRMFSVQRDFSVRGTWAFNWERAYSSFARRSDGPLGHGWTHGLAWLIEETRTGLLLHDETATKQKFPVLAVGQDHQAAYGRTLMRRAGKFTLRTDDGLWRDFEEAVGRAGWWRLACVRDKNGNRIALGYAGDRLVEITDTVGRRYRLLYDADGRIGAVEGFNAESQGQWIALARYQYSEQGDLITATDAGGFSRRYEYDDRHYLVAETNRIGLTYHFVYDDRGRCVETWGDYSGSADPALDPGCRPMLRTSRGSVPVKGIFHRILTYLDKGVTEVSDTRGGTRSYFSNKLGKVSKRVIAGAVDTKEFDALGRLVVAVDAEENLWRYLRDAQGRVVERSDPLGRVMRFTFEDDNAAPTAIQAPNGGTWSFRYDANHNLLGATDPLGSHPSTESTSAASV